MQLSEIHLLFAIAFGAFVSANDVPLLTPQGYFLEVYPDFDKEIVTTFVRINVATYAEPTSVIELDADPNVNLDYKSIKVLELTDRQQNETNNNALNVTAVERILYEPSTLRIHTEQKLQRDVTYQVQFSVEDSIANASKTGPFYLRKVFDADSNIERKYFAMDLKHDGCYKAFPCFNKPEYRIWFIVTVVRKPSFYSLSTTRVNHTTALYDDFVKDHFLSTPPMSINSLAIIVTDFRMEAVGFSEDDLKARNTNRTEPAIWMYPNLVRSMLTVFENRMSMRLPLPSLDLLIIQGETNVTRINAFGLVVVKFYKDAGIRCFINNILNGILSQWSKHLVTPVDSKGLLECYLYLIWFDVYNNIIKEFNIKSDEVIPTDLQFYFIDLVLTPEEEYRGLDYYSFKMLNDIVGSNVLNDGMNIFLRKKELKTYTKLDFWNAMDEAVKRHGKFELLNNVGSLSVIVNSWNSTYLPILTVFRDYSKNKISVTQESLVHGATIYDTNKLRANATAGYKPHWIPISIGQPRNFFNKPDLIGWLTQHNQVFDLNNVNSYDFIVVNPGNSAPVVVNYDPDNWNMLVENFNAMPVNVMMQLLCDSLILAHIDQIDYSVFLNMSASLIADESFLPVWNQYAYSFIPRFRQILHGSVLQKYNEFVRRQLHKVMKLKNTEFSLHLKKIACSLNAFNCFSPHEYETLIHDARMGKGLTGKYNCEMMANVSLFDWQVMANGLFHAFGQQNNNIDEYEALYVLSCTDNPLAIETLLNLVFLNFNRSGLTILEYHQNAVLYDFTHPKEKATALLDFTYKNFNKLKERLSPEIWEFLFKRLVEGIQTEDGLTKLTSMFNQFAGKFGSAEKIVSEGLDKIAMELDYQKPRLKAIEKWLDRILERISAK